MFRLHVIFTTQGNEGTIIRNKDGIYKLNHRSSDLQKYKSFQDDEYEIIGFKEGTNTDEGCVIWECKTPNGLEFSVRPRGTKEQRTEWFDNGESYIGSLLTVRYQELTDDGIPRFPVGIAIRDYE
jgi:DNA ligase-1